MLYDSAGNGLSFVLAVFNLVVGVLNWSQIGSVRELSREVAHTLATANPQPFPTPSPAPCPLVTDHTPAIHEVSVVCWRSAAFQIGGFGWLTLLIIVCWCGSRRIAGARPEPAARPQEATPQQAELRDLARAQIAAVRNRRNGGNRL